MTPEEIKDLVEKLEAVTGMECMAYRDLMKKGTTTNEEIRRTWEQDRAWFRGFADIIYAMT